MESEEGSLFDFDIKTPPTQARQHQNNEHIQSKKGNTIPEIQESSKYTFPPLMVNPYDRENWTVATDHCYARPWNWRPDVSFLRPAKTLFIQKAVQTKSRRRSTNPLLDVDTDGAATGGSGGDEEIDVESSPEDHAQLYDIERVKTMMDECDKVAAAVAAVSRTNRYDNWEEQISKLTWTASQHRLFNNMVNILNSFHMSRLAHTGANNEPLLRRIIIDKSVQRMRRLLASVSWDTKLVQWLHQLLIDHLNQDHLAAYLDILRSLKHKLPIFVDKMIFSPASSLRQGPLNNESLFNLLKRSPWDPVANSLQQDKPKKLPGNPIILIVPSGSITSSSSTSRIQKWMSLLSSIATVVCVSNMPAGSGRLTMVQCLDQMYAATRLKLQEVRASYPGRQIILLGFNCGGTLALQIAQIEPVLCVVCMGFSLMSAEGKRGQPDDSLLELQVPVLFVIGQCSNTALKEDVEDLRERMRIETGLIVVGAGDENLCVSKRKLKSEGITQSIVDRTIVDEIGEFVSGIILSPFPPQIRQSPTTVTVDKKVKTERKRYSSNTSSLDSEPPPSPTQSPKISRPGSDHTLANRNSNCNNNNNCRPPGSKSKAKLDTKWGQNIINSGSGSGSFSAPSSPNKSNIVNSPVSSAIHSNSVIEDDVESLTGQSAISPLKKKSVKRALNSSGAVKKIKTLKPMVAGNESGNTSYSPYSSPTKSTAKLPSYNLNRQIVTTPGSSTLSTLLQGGIKSIPATAPKTTTSGIKILENIQISPGTSNSPVYLPFAGKTGSNPTVTKKSIGGNISLTRPVKKLPIHNFAMSNSSVPDSSAGNLTTQDILNCPIIFADDNSTLLPEIPEPSISLPVAVPSQLEKHLTAKTPARQQVKTTHQLANPQPSKYVLVNKQPQPGNYVITPGTKKGITTVTSISKTTPKFTKIILSKRTDDGQLRSIKRVQADVPVKKVESARYSIALTPETSVKGSFSGIVQSKSAQKSSADDFSIIDLEEELVATAVPKPTSLH